MKFVACVALSALPLMAGAAEVLVNGAFEQDGVETYSPIGWSVVESTATGGVVVTDAVASPASGLSLGAAGTGFQAVIDTFAFGDYALSQTFTVGANASAILSFSIAANANGVSTVVDPTGLDHTTAGDYLDNQHFRVDVLNASAGAFDTGSSAVLRNLFVGGTHNGIATYTYDLTPELAAGGTFTLRFAGTSNLGQQAIAIDNVSLQVSAVPEPQTYALLLAGLGVVLASARRRA
ncbi:MAG: PEP-CTERM sorting domain-containing protein [Aquabacterium commune]